MEPREHLELVEGKGVVGDHTFGGQRHVTLIFEDDWNAAARQLGRDVDPSGRRANVLLSGGGGIRYLSTKLQIGTTSLEIQGITDPCPLMDRAAEGMREALDSDARAGIWGQVLQDGALRVGDTMTVAEGR